MDKMDDKYIGKKLDGRYKDVYKRQVLEALKSWAPDIIVVVAYGKILPEEVLNLPPMGCINVHGSLLPKYRGAAPIQWLSLIHIFLPGA